ncbi:MAG: four helix bundle protein [candidate division WOR-3 bacterium]
MGITNNQITITKHNFDLEERTLEFAKNLIRLCKKLPQNVINRELISQLIRAGGSVGANYREANDALSKKDFNHRIKITRKEAKESHYWLELIRESNPDFEEEINKLLLESLELKKIFSSIAYKI